MKTVSALVKPPMKLGNVNIIHFVVITVGNRKLVDYNSLTLVCNVSSFTKG